MLVIQHRSQYVVAIFLISVVRLGTFRNKRMSLQNGGYALNHRILFYVIVLVPMKNHFSPSSISENNILLCHQQWGRK